MSAAPDVLITQWVERRSTREASGWLRARLEAARSLRPGDAAGERALEIAFGRIPRMVGRGTLALTPDDLVQARDARPDWTPAGWSIDAAARILLLLHLPDDLPQADFASRLRRLRETADPAGQAALFQGLPLYPRSDALAREVGEGLRTNMRPVFEAIAHDNPYPRETFDQHRWNHMVLKALFVEAALAPVQGLRARNNLELAVILRDYARERRAAGRAVSPELWQCLAPFAEQAGAVDDLAAAGIFTAHVDRARETTKEPIA